MSEVEVETPKTRPKKGGKKEQAPAAPAPPAAGAKSYADLLKPPPAPKPEAPAAPAPTSGKAAVAAKPVAGAFDFEKFTKYVQYIAVDHRADLFHPSEEELARVKDVAFTHHFNDRSAERYAENMQELKRSLNTAQDCFMYRDTRYALYLPTTEELDLQQGWEIRNEKKQSFEGSYLVFSSDFKKVLEVSDREKGERKTRRAAPVNAVQMEAEKPAEKNGQSLVQRAKAAIAEWNKRVASKTGSEQRTINFTEAATSLLSSALETCFELKTAALITTTTTCILTHDLGATITCFQNNIRFSDWNDRERQVQYRKQQQGAFKKKVNETKHKSSANNNKAKKHADN